MPKLKNELSDYPILSPSGVGKSYSINLNELDEGWKIFDSLPKGLYEPFSKPIGIYSQCKKGINFKNSTVRKIIINK